MNNQNNISAYQAQYFAHSITRRMPANDDENKSQGKKEHDKGVSAQGHLEIEGTTPAD
jgi:hypothetical protein